MWHKLSLVLDLGEDWVNEDGFGLWGFHNGTTISAEFESIDDIDYLDSVLDIFEEASSDEKEALIESLNSEGYVSKFTFTVTPSSGEEYYFNQLTGGGGEPVVEDFYCDEDLVDDIESALDEIISDGQPPKPC